MLNDEVSMDIEKESIIKALEELQAQAVVALCLYVSNINITFI
jgi:hypothetical protein